MSNATKSRILEGIKYVLLDCDGVLWSGDHVLPGVHEALRELRHTHKMQLRFITNNASMSRAQMLTTKFHHLGLTEVTEAEILSSAYAARVALRSLATSQEGFDKGNVLVLGNRGLHDEVAPSLAPGRYTYGLELHQANPSRHISALGEYDMKRVAKAWDAPLLPPPFNGPLSQREGVSLKELDIGAVVIGLDFFFTPTTLALAGMILQRHERIAGESRALFIATNKDPQISIGEAGWLLPGAGSLVSSLEYVTGRQADMVCGKPSTALFDMFIAAEKEDGRTVNPAECLMVGDRLSTDIAFGNGAGARTLFVLCGCESTSDIPPPGSKDAELLTPTFVADSLFAALSSS